MFVMSTLGIKFSLLKHVVFASSRKTWFVFITPISMLVVFLIKSDVIGK